MTNDQDITSTCQRKRIDPEDVPLYGGISGITLEIPEFQLAPGLVVRDTYAHVMAPYLMAFAKPSRPGASHPAPWKAASGGLGFDVTIEMALSQSARPTSFNRLNTLWWILALLRLISGAPIRMPVISNIAFAVIPSSEMEPVLWTIEMPPHQLRVVKEPPKQISLAHLEWVRDVSVPGALLLNDEAFNRAFQTLDSAIWAHSSGSALLMVWAAVETLFRPGRQNITKTLASCMATFLYPPGSDRDRIFARITTLYEPRGNAIHDAQLPEAEQLFESFEIGRRALARCLELGEFPDRATLLEKWKQKS